MLRSIETTIDSKHNGEMEGFHWKVGTDIAKTPKMRPNINRIEKELMENLTDH